MFDFKIIDEDIAYITSKLETSLFKLAGKTLLITGANGFIPAYFVDTVRILNTGLLKHNPVKLICLTIENKEDCTRIKHALNKSFVEFIQQDIGKTFTLPKGIDFIVHAASKASPKSYLDDPIGTIDANVNGTRQILEYCVQNKVESFLFFSSGEIYGNPPPEFVPTREDYLGTSDWISPRSCYTESKKFSETLCINFFNKYKVPVKIVRPIQIYGPGLRLDDGRVIADFLKNGFDGKDIEILSDGLASRAFCYISDAMQSFWSVLLNGKNGEIYNVGNDKEEISIKNLALMVSDIFENKISVKCLNKNISYLKGSPSRSCPNIDKLRESFSFEPSVCLKDGLTRLKKWYGVVHDESN